MAKNVENYMNIGALIFILKPSELKEKRDSTSSLYKQFVKLV